MDSTRSTTLLGSVYGGDLTLAWDPDDDKTMADFIAAKMEQGFTFFVIENRVGLPPLRRKMKKGITVPERVVSVRDEDVSKLLAAGVAQAVKTPASKPKTVRRAKTSEEAAGKQTVGVRALGGG